METAAIVGICASVFLCAIGSLIIAVNRVREELKSDPRHVSSMKPSRSDSDLANMLPDSLPTGRHDRLSDPTPVSSEV
jgi:hypothetical protein